ncbi:MAG TPA: tetratricopeptide repeat protein [Polyangiaceae bacterium]
MGGCSTGDEPRAGAASGGVGCGALGEAACGGAAPSECARRALDLWSRAQGESTVACVAAMLDDACARGDRGACTFAGRMWLDGRGVAADKKRGIDLLVQACDGGAALACAVAASWLGDPEHARDRADASDLKARLEEEGACLAGDADYCYQVGLLFYFGRNGFPKDTARAVAAYEQGCRFGVADACNNLGDALAYGDGVERDLVRSAEVFDKACRLGEPLGCANWGQMLERGMGVAEDRSRARGLYKQACLGGEIYACLHAEMLAEKDAGVPRDSEGALRYWQRACARRDARACAYVGILYEDGPDGYARDLDKSIEAMERACGFGDKRACEWTKSHGP